MSYENIINKSKKIESILVKMGAEGKGLHQKVSSIEDDLDYNLIKAIRFMATIRNKFIHDDDFELDIDLEEKYNSTYEYILNEINSYQKKSLSENSSIEYEVPSFWEHLLSLKYVILIMMGIVYFILKN